MTERRREADAEENDAQSTAAAAASVRLSGAKTLIGNRERGTATAGRDKRRRGSERTERQGGEEREGGKKFPFVIYFRRGAAGRTEVQVVAVRYILSLLQSRAMCIGLAQLWGKCSYLKSIRSEDSIGI